jgi:MFS family permease
VSSTRSDSCGSRPTGAVSAQPGGAVGHGGSSLAVILGLLAGFAAVGSSGAAVVLPALSGDMGVSTVTSAWVISGFSLTYGVSMAVYGRIADLVGLRVPLIAGAMLMAAGSLVAASAPNFGVLMLGRLVQGAGGAAIPVLAWPSSVVSTRGAGEPR